MAITVKKADEQGIYFEQDPEENVKYVANWNSAVSEFSATIVSSYFSSDTAGVTLHSNIFTGAQTQVWVSGVTDGTPYVISNHIIGSVTGASAAAPYLKLRRTFRIKGKRNIGS